MTICAETEGAIAAKPWFPQTTIHKDGARNGNWIDVQGGSTGKLEEISPDQMTKARWLRILNLSIVCLL